eukprot:3156503-Prymnesium_polylepis.1
MRARSGGSVAAPGCPRTVRMLGNHVGSHLGGGLVRSPGSPPSCVSSYRPRGYMYLTYGRYETTWPAPSAPNAVFRPQWTRCLLLTPTASCLG